MMIMNINTRRVRDKEFFISVAVQTHAPHFLLATPLFSNCGHHTLLCQLCESLLFCHYAFPEQKKKNAYHF